MTSGPNDKTAQGKKRTTEKRPKGQVVLTSTYVLITKISKTYLSACKWATYTVLYSEMGLIRALIYMYDAVIPILWRLG